MQVRLRNPDRDVTVEGPRRVREVLADLGIDPDTVLVIRDRTLLTREERLESEDRVEIRPVISGFKASRSLTPPTCVRVRRGSATGRPVSTT